MSESQIIAILQAHSEFFTTNNFLKDAFRWLGWTIAKGAAHLCNLCTELYDWTFGLVDITHWTKLEEYMEQFRPLVVAFMSLTIVLLGFMMVLGAHKKNTIFYSFLIFAVVMTSSNYVFATLNEATILFKDAVAGSADNENTYTVLNSNLYDLLYIDKKVGLGNFPDDPPQYNMLTKEQADLIDINEVINYNSSSLTTEQAKAILKQKILISPDGDAAVEEVSNGWGWNSQDDTDLGNEFYYRYTFRFWSCIVNLGALILLYFCLSYKNVRIIWELLTSRILSVIFAADVSGTGKISRILIAIRDGYYALCFTAITLRAYILFQSYLSTRTEISGAARGIILLFVAWCAIDGANIMEKISGIDAGLSSASGKLIAGYHTARGAMHTVTGAAGMMRQNNMVSAIKEQTQALKNMSSEDVKKESDKDMQGMENAGDRSGNAAAMEKEMGNKTAGDDSDWNAASSGAGSDRASESGMDNMRMDNGHASDTTEDSYDSADTRAQSMEQEIAQKSGHEDYEANAFAKTPDRDDKADINGMQEGNMFTRMENKTSAASKPEQKHDNGSTYKGSASVNSKQITPRERPTYQRPSGQNGNERKPKNNKNMRKDE